MSTSSTDRGPVPELTLPEFARAFAMRAPRLALLIGAGASVTSGVPSAADLIWEFKREIYRTETATPLSRVGSLADPTVRAALQRYFDAKAGFPPAGAAEEYSAYFARAYSDPDDRRAFVAQKVTGVRPHYGYLCLGVLLQHRKAHYVWTPNFDELVAQGYASVTGGLLASVVGRDASTRLDMVRRDERYPIVAMLHGDFRFDALQNTAQEVALLDSHLREQFVDLARDYGLVVVGYSGRDASIMVTLDETVNVHAARAFPAGLFWCVREGDAPPARAVALLRGAIAAGVRASIVYISDFDDLATSLYRSCSLTHDVVDRTLAEAARTRTGYALERRSTVEPVLKLNGIPIVAYPESGYRFTASVPGWKGMREIVGDAEIVPALFQRHVHALGSRADIERVFGPHDLADLQPIAIGPEDLGRRDSKMLGMFYEAIGRALTPPNSAFALGPRSYDSRILYLRHAHGLPSAIVTEFTDLRLKQAHELVRHVRAVGCWVHEAIEYALDFREGQLWLVIRPTVLLTADGESHAWDDPRKPSFIRETLATRYNPQTSGLFSFWLHVVWHCTDDGVLRYPPGREVGFDFRLGKMLGVSYHRI